MATTIKFTNVELSKSSYNLRRGISPRSTHNRRGDESLQRCMNGMSRVGKLGEIAFAKFLSDNGKALIGNDDMFTVWNDTMTVDKMDFQTAEW